MREDGKFTVGYDFMDRFDAIEVELDRRFGIFNTIFSQNVIYQTEKFKDINKCFISMQNEINYLMWVINLPWYKKIWYKITNNNLKTIYNNGK